MLSREISAQSDALAVSGLYNVDNVNTRTIHRISHGLQQP